MGARPQHRPRRSRGQQQVDRLHHRAETDAGDGGKRLAGAQRKVPVARLCSTGGKGADPAAAGAQPGPARVRRLGEEPRSGRAFRAEGVGGGTEGDSADAGRVREGGAMTTLMQGLIQLSGHPLVHALGWTLLHFLWQGTAVALVLGCVLGLLGGQSSQARYGAACLALGLMVALPVATFAHVASDELKARETMLGAGMVLDAGIVLQVGVDEPVPPWPARIGAALDHAVPWVLLAWLAGVMVFAGRLNFGLLVARRLKSAGTEAPPAALQQLFNELRIRLGVERAVRLLHSAQVQVPTVIGWLRPVVLLPVSCLTGLSPEQIKAVLCHELAHVRRHDYLVSVVQSVIETVLFYHPAVWWVSKQVRRERECCCDQLAVGVGGNVLAYARALSYLEENRASFPEFVLGANGGVLKMRIKRLLRGKPDVEGSPVAALVALAMILAVAGSYFVAVSRAQAQAAREIASAALPAGVVSVSQEGATAD